MASKLADEAKEAFIDDDFQLSLDLYSQAISLDPKNADFFADRAQANLKLRNFTEAVADANRAIELDSSMVKAFLRKGTACIKLEEYQTAKAALEIGASLAKNDSRFTKLINECELQIAEENRVSPLPSVTSSLADCRTTNLIPGIVEEAKRECKIPQETSEKTLGIGKEIKGEENTSQQMNLVTPAKPKYRHGYYQRPEEVTVTIFAKGIPANHVVVDFGEQILSVTIDLPGEDLYNFQPRLFGKIIPDKCWYEVLSTKVEIRLVKAEAIHWTSLEYNPNSAIPQRVNVPSVASQRPSYPSAKLRTKDWDKLEAEMKKEEKEEKLDGDAALNKLFKDIYQNADEDMRRAMSKSFVESNGTVLSTDWKEVGSKKVEGSAPDGMELKKW